jgi:hypothetical protein
VESSHITERGWGGADVPPPNVQRADAEVRLAGSDALQWGLASVLYSGLLVLLVPLGLAVLLLVPVMATVTPSWDASGRIATTVLVPLALFVFDVLALTGPVLAVAGLRVARAGRHSAVLAGTGLVLGLSAVCGWIMTTVAGVMVVVGIWHFKI